MASTAGEWGHLIVSGLAALGKILKHLNLVFEAPHSDPNYISNLFFHNTL